MIKKISPLVYWITVSLPHHPFSSWLDKVFIDRAGYYAVQHVADVASWILLGVGAALGFRIAVVQGWRAVRYLSILLFLFVLISAADSSLIVNNMERVHFPQYAALALLIGLSLRSEMLIFFVASFAGFVDEFLQYVMDPMKTNYLDFNDILFNTLGAAAGVVLLMGLRKPHAGASEKDNNRQDRKESAKKEKGIERFLVNDPLRSWRPLRFAFSRACSVTSSYESVFGKVFRISMAVGGVVVLLGGLFGRIPLLVEQAKDRSVFAVVDGKFSFIISFERHDEFWVKSYFGKVFHVLSVGEGVLAITVLCLGTWVVVRWLRR